MKYSLERDEHGYAAGISIDGFWMIHLQHGTVRNEEYAQSIVDRLNGSDENWNARLEMKHIALLYAARKVVKAFPAEIPSEQDEVSFNIPAYLIQELADAAGMTR